jgi:hypothetical protein
MKWTWTNLPSVGIYLGCELLGTTYSITSASAGMKELYPLVESKGGVDG